MNITFEGHHETILESLQAQKDLATIGMSKLVRLIGRNVVMLGCPEGFSYNALKIEKILINQNSNSNDSIFFRGYAIVLSNGYNGMLKLIEDTNAQKKLISFNQLFDHYPLLCNFVDVKGTKYVLKKQEFYFK